MTPNERRAELEAQVQAAHDWCDGALRQWEACGTASTEVCTICGLRRTSYAGGQNSPDSIEYATAGGESLTLAEAARRGCE